jgi:hypothetical protein
VLDVFLVSSANMFLAVVFIVEPYEVCRKLPGFMVLSLLVLKCNSLEL